MADVLIAEPAILFYINRTYREGMSDEELYDATRGVWAARGKRRSSCKLAFVVMAGKIVEVYAIHEWHPAGTTPCASGRKIDFAQNADDWEFTGVLAPSDVRRKYIGQPVPPSNGNPIRYLNT
jgi:hypothetical protein